MLMKRLAIVLVIGAAACGCGQPEASTVYTPSRKPAPAAELAQLDRFVGRWTGSAEMVYPDKRQWMSQLPPGSAEPKTTFANGETAAWSLGGMHLRRDGWFEMPDGQKQHFVEYVTWDAKERKFRTSMISDWGDWSTGWMTVSEDGRRADLTTSGYDAAGNLKTGIASMNFVDEDTLEWTWSEKGPEGPFTLHGTSRRR